MEMQGVIAIAIIVLGICYIFIKGYEYNLASQDRELAKRELSDTDQELKAIRHGLNMADVQFREVNQKLEEQQRQVNALSLKAGFRL